MGVPFPTLARNGRDVGAREQIGQNLADRGAVGGQAHGPIERDQFGAVGKSNLGDRHDTVEGFA